MGKLTSFPRSVKLKPSETVIFSWIVYKSRAHRDRVNAKVMKDKRIAGIDMKDMPFDPKRMIYGGFKVIGLAIGDHEHLGAGEFLLEQGTQRGRRPLDLDALGISALDVELAQQRLD